MWRKWPLLAHFFFFSISSRLSVMHSAKQLDLLWYSPSRENGGMGGQRCRALSEERTVARLLHLRPSASVRVRPCANCLPSLSAACCFGGAHLGSKFRANHQTDEEEIASLFSFFFRSLMYVRSNSVVPTLILRTCVDVYIM